MSLVIQWRARSRNDGYKLFQRQSYDTKVSDPFYDSLEGLLHDLRTVTMVCVDSACSPSCPTHITHRIIMTQKPSLSQSQGPMSPTTTMVRSHISSQYLPSHIRSVIANPMDLQSMLKKVKSKQYKSKREFADDLDLIWSNCFTYNATEVCITVVHTRGEAHCAAQDHPLRQCAMRLKKKADRLLQNITDRKERIDPSLPPSLSLSSRPTSPVQTRPTAITRPKINGTGHAHKRSLSSSVTQHSITPKQHMDLPFAEHPALERTPLGMTAFRTLESQAGPSSIPNGSNPSASTSEYDSEAEEPLMAVDSDSGEKRKL